MESSHLRDLIQSRVDERRQEPRLDTQRDIGGELSSTRVRFANVSEHGCLVYAKCRPPEGMQSLRVECDGEELVVHARVVHVMRVQSPDQGVTYVTGLEFVAPGVQHETIQRLISACMHTEVEPRQQTGVVTLMPPSA